jgi:hypothetical protein
MDYFNPDTGGLVAIRRPLRKFLVSIAASLALGGVAAIMFMTVRVASAVRGIFSA